VTHSFNAQTPLHHRKPGVPGAALTDDRFYCEMICDGKHLHDDIVQLLIRCKGADRAVAITDAMEAAGMPDGEYSLGGQPVFVKEGAARLADGTLAGSVLTMPQALHNLIHRYHVEPASACAMCTSTPARSIGEQVAGHMVPGSPAIMTRWSGDWQLKSIITEYGESCQQNM
jgi:N-acetylglucosamine-6-phosphate deacetylase